MSAMRLSALVAGCWLAASLWLAPAAHSAPAAPTVVVDDARMARIAAVADAPTRRALSEMLFILHQQQRSEDMLREPPAQTVHATSRLAVLGDYADAARLADVYAAGVIGVLNERGDIGVVAPFDLPYPHTFNWSAIRFLDGSVVPTRQPAGAGVAISVQQQGQLLTLSQPDGRHGLPESLDGEVSIALPKATPHADFTRAARGQTRRLGDYAFTLQAMDDHSVTIGVTQHDGGAPRGFSSDAVIIEARDAAGQVLFNPLRLWGTRDQPSRGLRQFDQLSAQAAAGQLTVPDTATLLAKAGFKDANGQLEARFGFKGRIASVRVTLLVPGGPTLTRRLSASVLPLGQTLEGVGLTPLTLAGSVYDHDTPRLRPDIEPRAMAASVSVALVRRDDRPVIRFGYPDVLSDRFIPAAARFGLADATITFLDARGQPIDVREGEAYERVQDGFAFDPRRFPVTPVRAKGRLSVLRMATIERKPLPLDALPAGVAVNDNLALLDPARLPDAGQGLILNATDASGGTLREVGRIGLTGADGGAQVAYYFQGRIARLDALVPGKTERRPFDFDIPLSGLTR